MEHYSSIIDVKRKHFSILDDGAKSIAIKLVKDIPVSGQILQYIVTLYKSANEEKIFNENELFESAYHQPITADLEFFIARILYHYSKIKKLRWHIYLRKQKKNSSSGKLVAPDIKIEKNNKVVAILEIKAKAGFMKSFFSTKIALREKLKNKNPEEYIKKNREQLLKYTQIAGSKKKVFVFLPTFTHVSKKKDSNSITEYRKAFQVNSTLPGSNLIILSNDLFLNLETCKDNINLDPTRDFEGFIKLISK